MLRYQFRFVLSGKTFDSECIKIGTLIANSFSELYVKGFSDIIFDDVFKYSILVSLIRWHIVVAVLVLQSASLSFSFLRPSIKGYSQWSGLRLIESKGHWNFLNESTNALTNCSIYNCNDGRVDAETCPTRLKIVTDVLTTFPNNLFVNCFTRLNFLNVSNCSIEQISRNSFAFAYNLNKLDLSHNHISKVPSYTFQLAPNVEIIDLSYNQIGKDGIDSYAFEKCFSLKQLDLSNNNIAYITHTRKNWIAPLTNLEVLNLSDNCGSGGIDFAFALSDFYNNTKLVSLYARGSMALYDGTEYSTVSTHFPRLKHLIVFLSHRDDRFQTNITKYYRDAFDTNSTIFDTSGKYMNGLGISNNFKVIIANNNRIQSQNIICPRINTVVTELYLNSNELTDIFIIEKLPNLQVVDFSSNRLEFINETHFVNMEYLKVLNLANNRLQRLNICIVKQIPSLQTLDMSVNSYNDHRESSLTPTTAMAGQIVTRTSSYHFLTSSVRLLTIFTGAFIRNEC